MKTMLLASVAVLALGLTPVAAQTVVDGGATAGAAVGGVGGGAAGAGAGFLLGGPIGAVIGGFTGALIGSEAGVAATSVEFAGNNPVAPVTLQGDVVVGTVLPEDVVVYEIANDPQFGYIYANNRVWIVDLETRALVQSPGFLVTQGSADFAIANPQTSVTLEGELAAGTNVPAGVELYPLPNDPNFSYFYVNDRPVIVENTSRTIVFVN